MDERLNEKAEPFSLTCAIISTRVEPGQLVIRGKGVCYGDSTFGALKNTISFAVFRDIFQNRNSRVFSTEYTGRPRTFIVLFHELDFGFWRLEKLLDPKT
jgi:hypothetical protein